MFLHYVLIGVFIASFGVEFLFKFSELPVRMDVQRIYVGIYIIPFVFLISLSRIIHERVVIESTFIPINSFFVPSVT